MIPEIAIQEFYAVQACPRFFLVNGTLEEIGFDSSFILILNPLKSVAYPIPEIFSDILNSNPI